jgi:hypothetical protein
LTAAIQTLSLFQSALINLQVCDFRPMLPFLCSTPLAGDFLNLLIKQKVESISTLALSDDQTERLKLFLFQEDRRISSLSELVKHFLEKEGSSSKWNIKNDTEKMDEFWTFCSNSLLKDSDEADALPTAVLEVLMKCSLDSRREIVSSIVLCGGTSEIIGGVEFLSALQFRARSSQRFNHLTAALKWANFVPYFGKASGISFAGAAFLLTEHGASIPRISHSSFLQNGGVVPDWTCLLSYKEPKDEDLDC